MNTETKELRGLAPADLVRALDAIALAKGLDRSTYVNQILEIHVRAYINEFNLVGSMFRGNPLVSDSVRSTPL